MTSLAPTVDLTFTVPATAPAITTNFGLTFELSWGPVRGRMYGRFDGEPALQSLNKNAVFEAACLRHLPAPEAKLAAALLARVARLVAAQSVALQGSEARVVARLWDEFRRDVVALDA